MKNSRMLPTSAAAGQVTVFQRLKRLGNWELISLMFWIWYQNITKQGILLFALDITEKGLGWSIPCVLYVLGERYKNAHDG